jgi:uncharacterized protein (TIGR02996 family)
MYTLVQFLEARRPWNEERQLLVPAVAALKRKDWIPALVYADWLEDHADPLHALIHLVKKEEDREKTNATQDEMLHNWREREKIASYIHKLVHNPGPNWVHMPGNYEYWAYTGPDKRRKGVEIWPSAHSLEFFMHSRRRSNREGQRWGFMGRKMDISEVDTELLKAGFANYLMYSVFHGLRMQFKLWLEAHTLKGYGGPAFDPKQYQSDYKNGDFARYKQLYEDVQLELDNLKTQLLAKWKVSPKELIWFSDTLNPTKYTSGMTVESTWTEDYQNGIDYFTDLVQWLNEKEGEPLPSEELKIYDRSQMRSIYDLLGDWEWDTLSLDD